MKCIGAGCAGAGPVLLHGRLRTERGAGGGKGGGWSGQLRACPRSRRAERNTQPGVKSVGDRETDSGCRVRGSLGVFRSV
eukprot:9467266-Pyramimonas_sp.AAC.1